ncbi:MAG: hypothetical protein H6Q74_2767 [Firmicutes bacterium]|nr:hypothetical protein [Bacillota bacterium]
MPTAAAYIRVSTDEQAEQNISIPAQKSRIISYCHAKGWTIYDYYIDDGYSGKDLSRPNMARLITDAREAAFDTVIVWKLDRLSRRQQHVLHLIEDVFSPHNIGFSSVTENIDTSTPAGRAMIGVLAVFAQLERETIIERTRMGKKEAARQGRFGGGIPYGYDYDKKTKSLVINPIQAEAVKQTFDLYLSGQYGFQALADELTSLGFKSQKSGTMTKDQVKCILKSPFIAGLIKHLDRHYPGQHAAIIDLATWEKAQNLMAERSTPIPIKADTNLLTGLIWCGNCGARMRFKSRSWHSANASGKNFYYICYGRAGFKAMAPEYCSSPYHSASEINAKVIRQLSEYSFDPEQIKELVGQAFQPVDNTPNQTALHDEISTIDKQLERWYTAFENATIAVEVVTARIKALTDRKTALQTTVRRLEHNMPPSLKRDYVKEILSLLHNLPNEWAEFTTEQKRGLVFNLAKKITVQKNGEVLVEFDL